MRLPITRRATLAGLATGSIALAGCVDDPLFGVGATTTIGCVSAVNWHPRPHTVHLRVRRDGDASRRLTRDVPAARYRDGEAVTVPSVTIPGPWPVSDLPVIDVRLDERDAWRSLRPEDYRGPDCTELIVTISSERGASADSNTPGAEDTPRVVCRFSTSCETC